MNINILTIYYSLFTLRLPFTVRSKRLMDNVVKIEDGKLVIASIGGEWIF
jgi:hypothetical protein